MGSSAEQQSAQTTISTTNAPATGGANSPVNTTGTQLNVGGNYDASPTIATSAIDAIARVVNNALAAVSNTAQTVSDNNAANLSAQDSTLNQVLAAAQTQSASTSTGGQTDTNKTILYVVGAAFALLAVLFIAKKS